MHAALLTADLKVATAAINLFPDDQKASCFMKPLEMTLLLKRDQIPFPLFSYFFFDLFALRLRSQPPQPVLPILVSLSPLETTFSDSHCQMFDPLQLSMPPLLH